MLYIYRELDQNGKSIVDTNGDAISVTNIKVRQDWKALKNLNKHTMFHFNSANFEVLFYHNKVLLLKEETTVLC